MRFATVTELVLRTRRTECRGGKRDRDCGEAGCEEAPTIAGGA
jgi:hypothetical protein